LRNDCEDLLKETLQGGEVYISKSFVKKRIHPFVVSGEINMSNILKFKRAG
jgi:hypothetical protein